ncbi:MAG: hypothetical protein HY674_08810 [Chloroflexi bacterium]|nr:hypothetical protein [Chloroflexota bacterium]
MEISEALGPQANWTPLGNPVVGDDYFHQALDEHPAEGKRFYRVRTVTP